MNSKVTFNQKWIEKAVRNLLNKDTEDILKSDIEKIKYLRIGESDCEDFAIEMSLNCPPIPFVDSDGGDEWSSACIEGSDIPRFLAENKDEEDLQLSVFGFDYEENEEFTKYAESEEAMEKWEEFKADIYDEEYSEEFEDDELYEDWYDKTAQSITKDLELFTGVQVLRIKGMTFEDFRGFKNFTKLEVLEIVETVFSQADGIDELNSLKQLCCWMD